MKIFGFTLIRSDVLDEISAQMARLEAGYSNYNIQARRQTECQISVFSQLESRLNLLEAMHGVRFEPYDVSDLNKSGQGKYGRIDKKSLGNLVKKFTKAYEAIGRVKLQYKKWGIKK